MAGDHVQLFVGQVEHQHALAIDQPLGNLLEKVVADIKGGER